MTSTVGFTLQSQIECVERELKMRRHVYARRVSEGQMTGRFADYEIAAMEAVLATLTALAPPAPPPSPGLFDAPQATVDLPDGITREKWESLGDRTRAVLLDSSMQPNHILTARIAELEQQLAATAVPAHLHNRWNIVINADGSATVCRGQHEPSAGCQWERFVPEEWATEQRHPK